MADSAFPQGDSNACIAVFITYKPGTDCARQLEALAPQVAKILVVDNGSDEENCALLRSKVESLGGEFIGLGDNYGIAAAQNIGIRRAKELGARYVLISDHDSIASPTMVSGLIEAANSDPLIAGAGPLPSENREGADQLVYVARKWSPKRARPEELAQPTLDVPFLIASGCLLKMEAIEDIGPMNQSMFIDHVDLEWGLRALKAGWRLIAVPSKHLEHSLGDEVVQLPGRAQPVHVHSPIRNYYILRNTLHMVRSGLMPPKWRIRYTWWAMKYMAFNGLLADRLPDRRKMMWHALKDGYRHRLGKIGKDT